jgi:hypothetical protein
MSENTEEMSSEDPEGGQRNQTKGRAQAWIK